FTLLLFAFVHVRSDHLAPHSFPTRRSSDLSSTAESVSAGAPSNRSSLRWGWSHSTVDGAGSGSATPEPKVRAQALRAARVTVSRSEEHTSELQSRENLVCRLLLEKKNKKAE